MRRTALSRALGHSGPDNALQLDQFKPGRFDIMGLVPVGYALFAMALGITAGALLRRTLPALAVTLGGFIAVRAVIALWLRPHYMSAVRVTYKLPSGFTPSGSYWQLTQGIVNSRGQVVPASNGAVVDGIPVSYLPPSCAALARGASNVAPACRTALDSFRGFITYQPAGLYWAFQGIETGALADHLVQRYGAKEVAGHWAFEVWNEPNLDVFWSGTQAEYFRLYDVGARG
jgi:hypothetical protein